MPQHYLCYQLPPEERARVLTLFPPRYAHVKADHITHAFGVAADAALPPAATIRLVGRADDGEGIEALVAEVNGQRTSPDGRPYHLTLSYDPDKICPHTGKPYSAKDANQLVSSGEHTTLLESPLPLNAVAALLTKADMPMPTIEETIAFIRDKAHAGQVDKAGKPYYQHPVAVMGNLPAHASLEVKLAALLHDVIEDTPYKRSDLEAMGYSKATLDIVELVTKQSHGEQPYIDKIKAIIASGNEGAILVKYADMKENMNPQRLALLDEQTREKFIEKYRAPLILLEQAVKKLGYDLTSAEQFIR
jgi:hypothetical protein